MFKKKPKHDPATQVDTTDPFPAGVTLTTGQIAAAYQKLMQPTSLTWPLGSPMPLMAHNVPPDIEAGLKALKVGESIAFPDPLVPSLAPELSLFIYTFRLDDGSEYAWELGLATKVKNGVTIVNLDEIEETDELITGWRVFHVEDYKLKGSWLTWDGPENIAHCSCESFGDNLGVRIPTELAALESLRETARKHLANGLGTCGVYSRTALRPGDFVLKNDPHLLDVAASVVNYGLVYKYSEGYRAEKSRLSKLWVLVRDGDQIYSQSDGPFPARLYAFPSGTDLSGPSTWVRTPISHSTLIQVLSTTYGVPVEVMSPVEFLWRQESGTL